MDDTAQPFYVLPEPHRTLSINASTLTSNVSTTPGYEPTLAPKKVKTRQKLIFWAISFTLGDAGSSLIMKQVTSMMPRYGTQLNFARECVWIVLFMTILKFAVTPLILLTLKSDVRKENWDKMTRPKMMRFMIAGGCSLLTTSGKYFGFIFLPATVVPLIVVGLQMVFLVLIHRFINKRRIQWMQWASILVLCFGITFTATEVLLKFYMTEVNSANIPDPRYAGFLVIPALTGAIANSVQEPLAKSIDAFTAEFVFGVQCFCSFVWGVILFFLILASNQLGPKNYIATPLVWNPTVPHYFHQFVFTFVVIAFMPVVMWRGLAKYRILALSSAVTRKVIQQMTPFVVWTASLIAVNTGVGERLSYFSIFRLFGIIFEVSGVYGIVRYKKKK